VRSVRRLFENFQQRVRRSLIQLIRVLDQKDPRFAFKRTIVCFLLDLTHLFDAQHAFWRNDQPDVGMVRPDDLRPLVCIFALRIVEFDDARAGRTDATRLVILRGATVQSARYFKRKAFLADAFFTNEQHRTRQPTGHQHSFQRGFDALVSG